MEYRITYSSPFWISVSVIVPVIPVPWLYTPHSITDAISHPYQGWFLTSMSHTNWGTWTLPQLSALDAFCGSHPHQEPPYHSCCQLCSDMNFRCFRWTFSTNISNRKERETPLEYWTGEREFLCSAILSGPASKHSCLTYAPYIVVYISWPPRQFASAHKWLSDWHHTPYHATSWLLFPLTVSWIFTCYTQNNCWTNSFLLKCAMLSERASAVIGWAPPWCKGMANPWRK